MTETTEDTKTLTLLEAAKSIGVSVSTLMRAKKAGTLRVVRFGNRIRITDAELRRVKLEGLRTKTQ